MKGSYFEKQQEKLQRYKGYSSLLRNFERKRGMAKMPSCRQQALSPLVKKKHEYSCDELQQFIRFFPSHFTLRLTGTSLRYRHILDEVLLSIHSVPPKHRIPQYNLLGFLFALQGNYNYAFRYFHEVSALQENNIVSIANQAHCYLRQNLSEKAHDCLRKLIDLTSSTDFLQVTKESLYMSDAKTDLGYAYAVFGLTNAAKRMYESALTYNPDTVNANLGMAECLLALSHHENRSRREFYLRSAGSYLAVVQVHEPAAFLPASILNLRIRAENRAVGLGQINLLVEQIMKEYHHLLDARVFRDLAAVKLGRRDFEGELGAIALLERSVEAMPTAAAYHMLGQAYYLKWYKDRRKRRRRGKGGASKEVKLDEVKEGDEEEEPSEEGSNEPKKLEDMEESEMFQLILTYYESAAKKCYNSNLETLLELGIVCGRLSQFNRATQLIKQAVNHSEDISVQERGFRYLAIFEVRDWKVAEGYLRECLTRQHFVKLSEVERHEFWERVYGHAEELLVERGPNTAQYWIKLLVENLFPRADHIVEMYNKEVSTPLRGLNGEVPMTKKPSTRKLSRSRMV